MIQKPQNKPWRVLKSWVLEDNKPWLHLRQEVVELPNGEQIPTWYINDFPDWINVIAITEEGKFIVERQYRHGTQSIDFELCAGTIEKGEEPVDAAKRELLEETGYEGGEWSLYCKSYPNPAAMTTTNYTFLAKGVRYSGERDRKSVV